MIKKASIEKRIEILEKLGEIFRSIESEEKKAWWEGIQRRAYHENGWFSPDQTTFAIKVWGNALSPENIRKWAEGYDLSGDDKIKSVGVIMAGNIPMAGLHDLLSVILTGNKFYAKPSHQDKVLIPALFDEVVREIPSAAELFNFSPGILKGMDFYIATGSGNSEGIFKEFFGRYPNLIRGHRNSVAVITGNESEEDFEKLGEDIFTYYGLGCRSISKIYVPKGFDSNTLFKGLFPYSSVVDNSKYAGNFDYYRAIYLLNQEQLLENGFVLYKEDKGYSSPPSVIFWEEYDDRAELFKKLRDEKGKIQCLVGKGEEQELIPFGTAQKPELWDYADGVDTVALLLERLNNQ